jgi:hypothetical protein
MTAEDSLNFPHTRILGTILLLSRSRCYNEHIFFDDASPALSNKWGHKMAWNRPNERFHVSKASPGRSSIIIEDSVESTQCTFSCV